MTAWKFSKQSKEDLHTQPLTHWIRQDTHIHMPY